MRHFDHLMFNDGRDLSDVATASSNMGIVWFRSQRKGVSFIEHRGDIDPYHTAVFVMPSHDIGLVFLGVGGDNAYYTSVVESLIDEVLQSPCPNITQYGIPFQSVDGKCMQIIQTSTGMRNLDPSFGN
jgi:hypothetical protein